jgi:drug/metabolite transporter (DMT)-like permease
MNFLVNTNAYILMLISLSGFLSGEMTKCEYSRKIATSQDGVYKFTAYVGLICSAFIWCATGFSINLSLFTLLTSVMFGVAVMGQITASAFAMKIGPWAYTSVMMSLSTIIPALSGVLFWDEDLTVNIVLGMILMVICFVLSVKTDDDDAEKKKSNLKWFLLSLIASLSTGAIGILQKAHQSSNYKQELPLFLVISFGVASVFSFIMTYITRPKNNNVEPKNKIFSNKALVLFLVAGLGTAFNHAINLYLSGAMESAVFFPIMSGGELILVTLSSVIVFKEKLSNKQWIGLVCGIAAVIILCF